MTIYTPARFIDRMERTPKILHFIIKDIPQAQALELRDGADGWNVVEVMCHLRDFEEFFFQRARQIVEEDKPAMIPIDHEALVTERNYSANNLQQAFAEYLSHREAFLAWLGERQADDWARYGTHPEHDTFSLMDAIVQALTHDVAHTEQIVKILTGGA